MTLLDAPLVSVVIPCYNQAHFLPEAIESVLAQTSRRFEIIVVDDGSTDNTAKVAARYPGVGYFRQDNQGLAAARNTGLHYSQGDYLVFLDADDCLLPAALECGLDYLNAHPACAFVWGHYRRITADGSILPTWREERCGNEHSFISGDFKLVAPDGSVLDTWKRPRVTSDHYTALLQRNHIAMHATVMYRRLALERVGGFDPSLRACEDYELYLRLSRQFPIGCHDQVVADYRQHQTNMTRNSRLMLRWALTALRTQQAYIEGNPLYEQAYKLGEELWQNFYAKEALGEIRTHLTTFAWPKACRAAVLPLQYALQQVGKGGLNTLRLSWYRLNAGRHRLTGLPVGRVNFGALRRITPLGHNVDSELEQPIDHYYLEHFLGSQAADIKGQVLEVGCGAYSQQFSQPQPKSEAVNCNLTQTTCVADLICLNELPPASYDCIILPQALHQIYNVKAVIRIINQLLKPGGVLLATIPGLNQNNQSNAVYWTFTAHAVQRLFAETFPAANLMVKAYGNVLAATAYLHNLMASEFRSEELDYIDPHYQVVIAVRAVKLKEAAEIYDQ